MERPDCPKCGTNHPYENGLAKGKLEPTQSKVIIAIAGIGLIVLL